MGLVQVVGCASRSLAVCRPSTSDVTQLLISIVGPVHVQWVQVMLAVRQLSQFIVLLPVSL